MSTPEGEVISVPMAPKGASKEELDEWYNDSLEAALAVLCPPLEDVLKELKDKEK